MKMNDLLEFIIVQGDILSTVVRMFIIGFSFDLILGIASLIGESKKV